MKRFGVADLACLSVVLIWGCNLSIIKHALEDFSPLGFNAVRMLLAASLLLFIAERRSSLSAESWRGHLGGLILFGLLGNTVYQLGFIYALEFTRAGNVAILMATTTIFTALISRAVGHEKHRKIVWVGIAVSLTGVFLTISENLDLGFRSRQLRGDLLILGSSLCWAFYTVFARQKMKAISPLGFTSLTLAIGSLGFLILSIPSLLKQPWLQVRPVSYLELILSAVMGLSVAYTLWFFGVSRLGSTRTTVYGNLIPFVGVVVAWWFLGEPITFFQYLGGAAILTGIYLTRI